MCEPHKWSVGYLILSNSVYLWMILYSNHQLTCKIEYFIGFRNWSWSVPRCFRRDFRNWIGTSIPEESLQHHQSRLSLWQRPQQSPLSPRKCKIRKTGEWAQHLSFWDLPSHGPDFYNPCPSILHCSVRRELCLVS